MALSLFHPHPESNSFGKAERLSLYSGHRYFYGGSPGLNVDGFGSALSVRNLWQVRIYFLQQLGVGHSSIVGDNALDFGKNC